MRPNSGRRMHICCHESIVLSDQMTQTYTVKHLSADSKNTINKAIKLNYFQICRQISQRSFTCFTAGAAVARLTLTSVAVYAVVAGRSVLTWLTTAVVVICYIQCILTRLGTS